DRWASGVLPTRSSSEGWSLAATGHGRKEDHRLTLAHRRVETFEGAHVLALDVDVHERGDLAVLEELLPEAREARRQVLEHGPHGLADRRNLALAADLRAERGGNADGRHACAGRPAQNST